MRTVINLKNIKIVAHFLPRRMSIHMKHLYVAITFVVLYHHNLEV